jgi:hypothetical protein
MRSSEFPAQLVLKSDFLRSVLGAQTLTVTFTKPFDSLAETTKAVRSTTDVNSTISLWWCFLNTARNFFLGQASL